MYRAYTLRGRRRNAVALQLLASSDTSDRASPCWVFDPKNNIFLVFENCHGVALINATRDGLPKP
jgi:hypothetical protein